MSRALARAISAVEDGTLRPDSRKRPALVVGITGPPGAGKSTVVDALLGELRKEGRRVAVLAVDPSSPFSGGALLGDRVRMNNTEGVFVRSLATRGAGGGLAPRMRDVLSLVAGHGYEAVVIETAGTGQEEIAVTQLADVTALVTTPANGDFVQAGKAGLLEAVDLIVLNKCDLAGAGLAGEELREATDLPVVRMIAKDGEGAAELLRAIQTAPRGIRRRVTGGFEIDHIGIATASIEEALRFYTGQLGMRVTHRETVEPERVHVAMLDAAPSRIELLEATSEDSTIAKFLANRGPGIHHVAVRVPDFEATIARLKDSGARLLNEPRTGAGGHKYVFVHPASAGGVLLELIAHEHP